jgi:hypothetical protein
MLVCLFSKNFFLLIMCHDFLKTTSRPLVLVLVVVLVPQLLLPDGVPFVVGFVLVLLVLVVVP